jgi:hypothetical protein
MVMIVHSAKCGMMLMSAGQTRKTSYSAKHTIDTYKKTTTQTISTRRNTMILKCSYKGCKRQAVSGSNIIADVAGDTYDIDLCEHHLRKLLPKNAVFKEG